MASKTETHEGKGSGESSLGTPAGGGLSVWFAELKRRRVFRALVGYGIAAFAALQIVEPVMHGAHWPEIVLSYVVAGLAAGFPIVIALAWIFDVKAGRIERTAPVAISPGPRGIRLALLLVGIGVLAAAPGLIWYFFVRGIARPAAVPAPVGEAAAASIAVLPFVDMSPGKDQEYFSDGIAEEILNALTQVNGLQVTGRTSSFSFKGKNEDLRTIGQKLGVGSVLEGSVRKSGVRVRVTAQVVKAADGFHLWSQTFDRDLTDVFAVQEEIAKAVVDALKVKLVSERQPSTKERRTNNPEAHEQFLLGQAFARRGSPDGYRQAVTAYERALALDPNYAPAWAGLAISLEYFARVDEIKTPDVALERKQRARQAAEKAVSLAPGLAQAYTTRGWLRFADWDWLGAQADFERARSLDPGGSFNQAVQGSLLASLGRLDEAIALEQRQTQIDPLSATSWHWLAVHLSAKGRLEQARAAIERSLQVSPENVYSLRELGFNHLLAGRPAEALAIFARSPTPYVRDTGVALAQHSLGHPKESEQALQTLIQREADRSAWQIAQIHAWRGDREAAFQWLDRALVTRDNGLRWVKYDPFIRNLRGDPRYTALLKKLNLPVE